MLFDLLRHPSKGRPRHRGRDRRDARLVPSNAGVQNSGAFGFNSLGKREHFVKAGSLWDQIDHGQAENNDKIIPHRGPHRAQRLNRKSHAVLVGSPPCVRAFVSMRDEELIDQIPLGPH